MTRELINVSSFKCWDDFVLMFVCSSRGFDAYRGVYPAFAEWGEKFWRAAEQTLYGYCADGHSGFYRHSC